MSEVPDRWDDWPNRAHPPQTARQIEDLLGVVRSHESANDPDDPFYEVPPLITDELVDRLEWAKGEVERELTSLEERMAKAHEAQTGIEQLLYHATSGGYTGPEDENSGYEEFTDEDFRDEPRVV